ncbi:hypothetical protein MKW98_011052 [Papaver atlanticum]|uniref:Thioesterase domain-containing protein n=1 Tax=Papaver atlanticum TaxID=357466 RepID=A0AAD4TIY8_9MAGN|nr:hypothetical protein MKW98_011052 [Papaver atlanticum]
MASLSRSSSLISCPASNTDETHPWNSKENTYSFLQGRGAFGKPNEASERKGLFSDRILDLLKVDRIEPGRIICSLIVNPLVNNPYGTLHGGAVAAVAKLVAMACALTVVDEDKDLYLGELNMSYHSASAVNVELEVDGCILKRGRNVTTAAVEFRVKGTKKVAYTARATFFTTPVSKL